MCVGVVFLCHDKPRRPRAGLPGPSSNRLASLPPIIKPRRLASARYKTASPRVELSGLALISLTPGYYELIRLAQAPYEAESNSTSRLSISVASRRAVPPIIEQHRLL